MWPDIAHLLEEQTTAGADVSISLQWEDESTLPIDFGFHNDARDDSQTIHVYIGGIISHTLCGNFTDYSWYLTRTVCPMINAGYNVWFVNCEESY